MILFSINTYSVPQNVDTSFKAWMPHTAITSTESMQYQLQEQAYTDQNGFRKINDDYMVAMGTFYTSECGDRFSIELENENVITVIVGDIKADRHTDKTNRFTPVKDNEGNIIGANVLEFIVDTKVMPRSVLRMGTVSELNLEGNIVSITKIMEDTN